MFADELDRLEREQYRHDGGYQTDRLGLSAPPTPVVKRPVGRPRVHENRTVYMREYMRNRRKQSVTVDEGPGALSTPARGQAAA